MMKKSHMEGDEHLILKDDKNRAKHRNVIVIARRNKIFPNEIFFLPRNKILTGYLGIVRKLNIEKNQGKNIFAQQMGRGIYIFNSVETF